MLDINVSNEQQITLVEVRGRIDSMNAHQLGEGLSGEIDNGHIQLVLDLSQVDYMSSAGLREIVSALKKVQGQGMFGWRNRRLESVKSWKWQG